MSELQLALLGAGAVAIAGVWGYNLWQDRQHRQAAKRVFKGDQPDVLLKDASPLEAVRSRADDDADERDEPVQEVRAARIEPSFSERAERPVRVEPTVGAPDIESSPSPVLPPAVEKSAANVENLGVVSRDTAPPANIAVDVPADEMTECIVRFSLPVPVPAANVWMAQQVWSSVITKPIRWLGRSASEMFWRPVSGDSVGRYSDWLVALQLADRNGAVSDIELRQFFTGIDGLGQLLGIAIKLPERVEVLLRAQSLDSFCAGVDVQFSIHVVETSGGTFPGTKLRGVCEAAGLSLAAEGYFHSVDDNGMELFRLTNIGPERFTPESIRSLAVQGVTLTIDVPRVADGTAAFNRMITTAQQLARGLSGVLVDVQRAPLADAMITMIRAKIVELQQQMRAADIQPGTPRALKLFS